MFTYLKKYPEVSLDRWAKKFGPIYSLMIGHQRFVILSEPHVVKDILVTNGSIFSSRKEMFIKVQTILVHRGITGSGYNEVCTEPIAAKLLTAKAVMTYGPAIELEAREMVRTLLIDGKAGARPINPSPYASRSALNNILMLIYGTRTESMSDSLVSEVLRISREFMNTTGSVSNLVDFLPFLQYFPNRMTTRARKLHQEILNFNIPFLKDMETRLKRGDHVPDCLAKTLILTREAEGLDDLDVIIMCGTLIIGGVETTASIQQWFAAHIADCPDIQEKAQAELDRIVGRDRLPNEEDEMQLPYIRAIAKEVARFHNPFWLGTPHYSTEDFAYHGYYIPKGTVVIANTWTMHRDPVRYPDPYSFNPERYLDDNLASAESAHLADPMERDHWSFGIGFTFSLTSCHSLLGLATMLWAFNIQSLPEDPIDLKEYDGVSGRSPVPFRVKLIPRDSSVAEALRV
ncbi:cytochrome P450 [Daedaleopsis nitida]|nr:cytochrome P450 [Daedaleopsis nitida]